jgi:acetylornithine deacetylase/succinyl-diaminopimelate desuccinylase-like protein
MMNFAEIVEKEKDVLFEILSKIISFPSINPPGNEGDAQKWVAGKFQEFGLDCDMFEVFPGRPDVVGFLKGTGKGRSLILNGHIDVVPARLLEEWSSDPFEAVFKDERVYGRGVTDMKGALACFLFIGFLLKKYNIRLSGDLLIQSVVGEEQGELANPLRLSRYWQESVFYVDQLKLKAHTLYTSEPVDWLSRPEEGRKVLMLSKRCQPESFPAFWTWRDIGR